jgi:hypothetical protein
MDFKSEEQFKDIKGVISMVNPRTDTTITKRKGETTIYKTLHRKLVIEQHEHH